MSPTFYFKSISLPSNVLGPAATDTAEAEECHRHQPGYLQTLLFPLHILQSCIKRPEGLRERVIEQQARLPAICQH